MFWYSWTWLVLALCLLGSSLDVEDEDENSLRDSLLSPSSTPVRGVLISDLGVLSTSGSSVSGEVMCMSWKYCIRGSVMLLRILCSRSFTGDLSSSLLWRRKMTVWLEVLALWLEVLAFWLEVLTVSLVKVSYWLAGGADTPSASVSPPCLVSVNGDTSATGLCLCREEEEPESLDRGRIWLEMLAAGSGGLSGLRGVGGSSTTSPIVSSSRGGGGWPGAADNSGLEGFRNFLALQVFLIPATLLFSAVIVPRNILSNE